MDISVPFDTNKESKPKAIYVCHLSKSRMNSTHLRLIFDLPSVFVFNKKSKFQQMLIVGMTRCKLVP